MLALSIYNNLMFPVETINGMREKRASKHRYVFPKLMIFPSKHDAQLALEKERLRAGN